eukprot:ANDGO_07816.mRNA.1 hypothetical protein
MRMDIHGPNIGTRLLAEQELYHHRERLSRVRPSIDNAPPASFVARQHQRLIRNSHSPKPLLPLHHPADSRPSSRQSNASRPSSRQSVAGSRGFYESTARSSTPSATSPHSTRSPEYDYVTMDPAEWRSSEAFAAFVNYLSNTPMSEGDMMNCAEDALRVAIESRLLSSYSGASCHDNDEIVDAYNEQHPSARSSVNGEQRQTAPAPAPAPAPASPSSSSSPSPW